MASCGDKWFVFVKMIITFAARNKNELWDEISIFIYERGEFDFKFSLLEKSKYTIKLQGLNMFKQLAWYIMRKFKGPLFNYNVPIRIEKIKIKKKKIGRRGCSKKLYHNFMECTFITWKSIMKRPL